MCDGALANELAGFSVAFIPPGRRHVGARNKSPGLGPGLECMSVIAEEGLYSCPYFFSTSRHVLPTRQLCAASVAPQRSKLPKVMPPERSHSLAAAGLQGASSARSTALAVVVHTPIRRHAASIVFMLGQSLVFVLGSAGTNWLLRKKLAFCAPHKSHSRGESGAVT